MGNNNYNILVEDLIPTNELNNTPVFVRNRDEFITSTRILFGNKFDKLIDYLSSTSYFYDPAGKSHHGNHPGGLYIHSKSVYSELYSTNLKLGCKWSADKLYLIGFCHDLCKVGLYGLMYDSTEDGNKNFYYSIIDNSYDSYTIHGTKSLRMLGEIVPEMIDEELAYSIVYHMGVWTKDAPDFKSAIEKYDLVFFTHAADMIASRSDLKVESITLDNSNNINVKLYA